MSVEMEMLMLVYLINSSGGRAFTSESYVQATSMSLVFSFLNFD